MGRRGSSHAHDLSIVPSTGERRLRGVMKRVHGIGPARRVEIALGQEGSETLIEVDALRAQAHRVGQVVGIKPEQYRLFAGQS